MPGLSPFGFEGASPPPPPFVPVYSRWALPPWRSMVPWAPPAEVQATGTDHDIIEDIKAKLGATDVFDEEAVIGYESPGGPAKSAWKTMARVIPDGAEDSPEFLPSTLVRNGSFRVLIDVEEDDPVERNRRLNEATTAAINALNGRRLAGFTAPALTIVRKVGKTTIKHPVATAELRGTYSYISPGYAGLTAED